VIVEQLMWLLWCFFRLHYEQLVNILRLRSQVLPKAGRHFSLGIE